MDKKDSWGLTEEEIQERLRKLCASTGTVPNDNRRVNVTTCQWGRFLLTTSQKSRVSMRTVPIDMKRSIDKHL